MRLLFTLLTTLVFAFGCEKDRTPVPIWDFMPLEEGAVWTYATVMVDTNGLERHLSDDTLWLQSLETVGAHRFASFEGTDNFLFQAMIPAFDLQDSSGILINSNGQMMLSTLAEHHELLLDERELGGDLGRLQTRLFTTPVSVDVPYGTFECIGRTQTVDLNEENHPSHMRRMYRYYGKGAGIVKATAFFLSSPSVIETRLTGFYFQE